MSKKNKLFSITVLASMIAMTGCSPANVPSDDKSKSSQVSEAIPLDVDFLDKEVLYDGKVHSIEIEGELPEGVSVTYSDNNSQVNVGSYGITAYFSDAKGTLYQSKSAVLTIKDSNISSNIWNSLKFQGDKTTFVYDGNIHSLAVDPNTIPEGFEVSRYTGNSATNVGEYPVTVYIRNKVSKVEVYSRTTIMAITKADIDMSQVTFEDKEFSYDGKVHTLSVDGLDSDLVEVSYSNNGRINQGSQVVTASFKSKNKNYNDPSSMTARLTVTSATETVKIAVRAIYNGNNYTVMGDDGNVVDTNQTAFIVSLPVGGTLTEDMLPVLAFKNANNGYDPAPLGAYTATFKTDSVTEVNKQTTPIELEVTYTATIYSITYAYTNSKKGTGTEVISYSFDNEINLPTPSMNDGYEFTGWSYLTNYDVTKDVHYSNRIADATKFQTGTVSTAGRIPARTCVGNLHLTVTTMEIGASSSIVDQQKVYNGKAEDIEIKNKNPNYYYELSYLTSGGYSTSGAPKDIGSYTATLRVYKDATKTVQVIPEQSAIFTIVSASLSTLGKNVDGNVVIYEKESTNITPILNSDGSEAKSIFTTLTDSDTSYDLEKNVFTYTYDGKQKEVAIKLATIEKAIVILKNDASNNKVPFIPHITYRNISNGVSTVATTTAPTNAGTYEINVTFNLLNSDSSNYNTLPDMKCTMIINKKNVEKEVEEAENDALQNKQYPLWTNDEGVPYVNNSGSKFTFAYEEGKEHTLIYDITASSLFPKGIEIDHYSGQKASGSINNKVATVYFRSTDPNIEAPSPRSVTYSVTSNACIVTFYSSTNLDTPIASYNVVIGDRSPLPTLQGDDTNNLGYDTYYYLKASYNSTTQTGTDATNILKAVTAKNNEIVVVRKPHIYNIKYVISSLADNTMNENTYSVIDDEDKVLKAPTLANSTFLGWYLDPNFSSSVVNLNTPYNRILDAKKYSDLILYAKFSTRTPSVYFYLTEDSVGEDGIGTGSIYATITNSFGQTYRIPESKPTREGHTFKNWYILENGVKKVINETVVVTMTNDHAIFADWEKETYNVTVQYQAMTSSNDYTWKGSTETYTIKYGDALTTATNILGDSATYQNIKSLQTKIENDATSMGYSFDGFYATTGEKISVDDYIFTSTSNQAFTARFTAKRIKVNYYFAEFPTQTTTNYSIANIENITIASSISLYTTVDQILNVPSNEQLSKDGYNLFAFGWLKFNDASLTSATYDPSYNLSSVSYLNSDLRHKLMVSRNDEDQIDICIQYNVKTYIITFVDTNGLLCDGKASSINVGTNGTITAKYRQNADFPTPTLNDASYNGYDFDCWEYESSQFKGRTTYEYTKDITVKLKTTAKEVSLNYYTDTNGSEILSGLYKVKIGDYYTIPSITPEKEGCTFVGWVTRTTYERVKTANNNTAVNYSYIWQTRNSTTNVATKKTYYTDSDFITSVTTVEQTDFKDDSYALYAVYIRNEYNLSIEYTTSSATGDTTNIKKINGTYLFQVAGDDATVGKWDQYIYVTKDDATAVPLSINTNNETYTIPERGGYDIQGLTLGNSILFTVDANRNFKLAYKATEGDYEPGKGNISWTNPMVLTVSYKAIAITSHISVQQKTGKTVTKEVERNCIDANGNITKKTVTADVTEYSYEYVSNERAQTYGANMLLPNDPVLDGYTFKKWIRTDANGNVYYIKQGQSYVEATINSDSVVNSFDLFTFDGTNYNEVTLSPNSDIYVKALYDKNPLTFTFTGSNDEGQKVSILTSKPDSVTSQEVTQFFIDNPYGYQLGTSSSGAITFKYFDNFEYTLKTINLPELKTIQGYGKGKWVITIEVKTEIYSENGLTYVRTDSSTKTISLDDLADQVLKNDDTLTNIPVTVQYAPKTVQINYYQNDGTFDKTASVNYSSSFTLPTAREIEGKTFAGWRLVKLRFNGDTQIVDEETSTIINSGTITLDNFNYISINQKSLTGGEDEYFIRFDAVYVDKSYKIKFNIANGDNTTYLQDGLGEYNFSIKNKQLFSEVMLGNDDEGVESLQLAILKKLGLDPQYYALSLRSQKQSGSSQKEFYCYSTNYNALDNKYTDQTFTGSITNLNDGESYSYSTHGAEFVVNIIYLQNDIIEDDKLFKFEQDDANKEVKLTGINGNKMANDAIYSKKLMIPSYIAVGQGKDGLYKVTSLGAGFLYNGGQGISLIKDSIESISISATITTFEKGAFTASATVSSPLEVLCSKLTQINYLGSTYEWTRCTIEDPTAHPLYLVSKSNYYNKADNNQTLRLTFSDNYSTTLKLSDEITSVSKYAFINMSYLTKISFSTTITSFGLDCFRVYDDRDCTTPLDGSIAVESYVPVDINTGLPLSGKDYNVRTNLLESVNYSGGLANWANITFESKYSNPMSLSKFKDNNRGGLSLGKLYLSNGLCENIDAQSLTEIKDYVFYNCGSVKAVTLTSSTTSIGKYAFSRTAISRITLSTSINTLGEGAFAYCPNLRAVTLSSSISRFEANLFLQFKSDATSDDQDETSYTFLIEYTGSSDDFAKVNKPNEAGVGTVWYGTARYNSPKGQYASNKIIDFKIKYSNFSSAVSISNASTMDAKIDEEWVDCSKI